MTNLNQIPLYKNDLKEIPKPLESTEISDYINKTYYDFLPSKDNREEIFELTEAANYMAVEKLVDLCCAYVASLIKGKSVDEVVRDFDIKDELTDSEKKIIEDEFKYTNQEKDKDV